MGGGGSDVARGGSFRSRESVDGREGPGMGGCGGARGAGGPSSRVVPGFSLFKGNYTCSSTELSRGPNPPEILRGLASASPLLLLLALMT